MRNHAGKVALALMAAEADDHAQDFPHVVIDEL
jgi:hypothetical protein